VTVVKLKHWRGFAAINAANASPMLEFDGDVLSSTQ
jgi:hypothetical protein